MINKVILVGNLGREPDIKFTGDGKAIANLAVATSESWTDKNTQQKVEKTEWHRVVVFGKLADICQRFLHKGSKVFLEGQLRTRKWDKEGVTQYTTEVVLSGFNSNLMMLDSKGEPYEPTPVNLDVAPEKKIQPVDDFEDDMEDIPF
jgi:single-strand DNA-binding protein|tara:strand:- start:34 stop:474 length:441 start_codon:yes stop_codon:yes gene_type:complete